MCATKHTSFYLKEDTYPDEYGRQQPKYWMNERTFLSLARMIGGSVADELRIYCAKNSTSVGRRPTAWGLPRS